MHPNAVEAVVTQLTKVAEGLVYPAGFPNAGKKILEGTDPTSWWEQSVESIEAERGLVEQLLGKQKWGRKVSERFLRKKIDEAITKVLETRSTAHLQGVVDDLVREVEGLDKRRVVLIPFTGLEMKDVPEFELGNVLIKDMTGNRAAETLELHRSIVMKNPHYTVEQKHNLFERYKQHVEKVTGRVCAEYRVVAEPIRAQELAVAETRRAVDLLRFAVLNLRKSGSKYVIGIQGDVSEDTLTALSVKEDESGATYRESMVHERFVINPAVLDKMKSLGVFDLSDLLKKDKLTDFDELILRGVHWLASAQAQPENENALLNLVTCLETFLKPAKDDPITATIAEGVAILTAQGLDARRQRKKRVKDFYGMRSRLSHEGEGTILDADLLELTGIAREVVTQMIRRREEFPSQETLRNWIDDEKLR